MRELDAQTFGDRLRELATPEKAKVLQGFFKTGPGEYGEGDVFIGVTVPQIRKLVREYRGMPPREALLLVRSAVHEERLAGLLLWVDAYERGSGKDRDAIFRLYLANTRYINNWDLVDLSAPQIVGGYILAATGAADISQLEKLARSALLWERRIATLATLSFIRAGELAPTLRICTLLLDDRHDLMHKACGWMLRELGKRDRDVLRSFLDQHAARMPRTMLRYALEHFPAAERGKYMRMPQVA